jgi:UDP-N-acetylglucosamine acyltransferase
MNPSSTSSETSQDLTLFDIPGADAPTAVEIHPTAIVAKGAQLGVGVRIGPYCVISDKAILGDYVQLASHVSVENRTTVGARTVVYQFATLGVNPQDLKFHGEDTVLEIGEENSIRQYVNMSIGSAAGGGITRIGRRNLFMAYSHVAHDCSVGSNLVFANGATLGGHVQIGDHAVIGGLAAVHQFVRIGSRAMIGGGSMVVQDVPPFVMVQGDRARPNGLNVVGLRRSGYGADALRDLKNMYRLLYSEGLTVEDALKRIQDEVEPSRFRTEFVEFVQSSHRGVCR